MHSGVFCETMRKTHSMSDFNSLKKIDTNKKCVFEYIWLDVDNEFRSKAKTIDINTNKNILEQLPIWNYDGSSTGQAESSKSEINLNPVAIFKDPFRKDFNMDCYLVWCETSVNNNRIIANQIFQNYLSYEPWFGLEQEYFIMDPNTNKPIGLNENEKQGKYYCGVGHNRAIFRQVPEMHYSYCLYAGIKIGGINGEVAPAQWEYQIGPCVGISAGDHLWVSRYILNRIAENFNCVISYHPKSLGKDADWNGSGCHTNFSTNVMRDNEGLDEIHMAITRLSFKHTEHMKVYGSDNEMRLTGLHETSNYDRFTYGFGNRNVSIRIPNNVIEDKKGYFEDRRPASNCDPYLVTSIIMDSSVNPDNDGIIEKIKALQTDFKFENYGYIS